MLPHADAEVAQLLATFRREPHLLGRYLGYDRLQAYHGDWIRYCWLSKSDVSLWAHRNSYKTTSVLVVGTIWCLLFWPETRILILRKTHQEARKTLREIGAHYGRPPLRALYARLGVREPRNLRRWSESNSLSLVTKQQPSKEGNIEPLGVGSALTGAHYDKILADDIITLRDRVSRAERERTKIYVQELANIPVPGASTSYTGTPWHPEDAWKLLPPPKRFPLGSIDVPGLEIERLRARMTRSMFALNYELQHIADEERLFKNPNEREWPVGLQTIAFVDPAYGGRNQTALAIGGRVGEGRASVAHVRGCVWDRHVIQCFDAILSEARRRGVGTIYVEANRDLGAAARDLAARWPAVSPVYNSGNKHIRITTHALKNWHRLFFPIGGTDVDAEFLNAILDYAEGDEPDDAPDALAGLVERLRLDPDLTESFVTTLEGAGGRAGPGNPWGLAPGEEELFDIADW